MIAISHRFHTLPYYSAHRHTSMIAQRLLLIFVIGCSFAQPLLGQEEEGSYTLRECIDIALKRNLDVLRSANAVERATSYRTAAYGEFLPRVSAQGSWVRSDKELIRLRPDGLVQSRNSWNYSVEAGVTIFNGMRNFNTVDKSLLDMQAAEQYANRRREDVVYLVQEYFYNALRYKQLMHAHEANLERSSKQLERVRTMNVVGSVPLADVYRQEVQVGTDELVLLESGNNYKNILIEMQSVLGLDPNPAFTLNEAGTETVRESDMLDFRSTIGDFENLVNEAEANRSDFREAELNIRGAEKGVAIAKSGHYPSLTAFAQYSWNNLELRDFDEFSRFMYGLSLSVPIFSNFQVSTSVQQSEIMLRDTQLAREQLRRNAASELMKSLNILQAAEVNMDISARKLQSAREDHRIASERYSLGSGTLLDQITASANLRLAESDVINARFNYLTAQSRIEYQLGRTQY